MNEKRFCIVKLKDFANEQVNEYSIRGKQWFIILGEVKLMDLQIVKVEQCRTRLGLCDSLQEKLYFTKPNYYRRVGSSACYKLADGGLQPEWTRILHLFLPADHHRRSIFLSFNKIYQKNN